MFELEVVPEVVKKRTPIQFRLNESLHCRGLAQGLHDFQMELVTKSLQRLSQS